MTEEPQEHNCTHCGQECEDNKEYRCGICGRDPICWKCTTDMHDGIHVYGLLLSYAPWLQVESRIAHEPPGQDDEDYRK